MARVIVSIYDNFAEVNAGGMEVGLMGMRPAVTPYTGKTYPHFVRQQDGGIRFVFADGVLNATRIQHWRGNYGGGILRQAPTNDPADVGKNNCFGLATGGPFGIAARALLEGGAKTRYNVDSPLILYKWTASNLAKYCSHIKAAAWALNHGGM